MADLYWVTFRLEKDSTWQERYTALDSAISDATADQKWWKEPTSFYLFRSELGIDEIVALIKEAISAQTDVVVIGMPDYKSARVIGTVEDDDIFTLWDWVQQASS